VKIVINEEKVKTMTKLAIYETTKGKRQLNISKYYKRDYIRYHMFKTAVAASVAFLLLAVGYVLLNFESLMLALNDMDLIREAEKIGLIYVLFLVFYMLVAWLVYARRYEAVKPDVIVFNHNLKHLKELYDKEEKELNDKRMSRSVDYFDEDINNY
jgi:hypothetical protein